MKVTVIGTGYVGLVTGTCLAELGNHVICLDIATEKIRSLNSGIVPIYEPGLDEMIHRNRLDGRIEFTSDTSKAIEHGEIIFIAVGTPPASDGSADLTYVLSVAKDIGHWMKNDKVVVNKSTVPVGTAEKVTNVINQELNERGMLQASEKNNDAAYKFSIISNPEFLKEGAAIEDFMRPDRVVLGYSQDEMGAVALSKMRQLYAPFNRHHDRTLVMSTRAAAMTKYAANAMLATRISFMNELANLAEVLDVDIESVRMGIGSDPRIGYSFLYAGAGYGGSCFPKDVQALQQVAHDNGQVLSLLQSVEHINFQQKNRILEKMILQYGEDMRGLTFAVWGLAFKPETDDMREAPSRVLIKGLLERGAKVKAFDPVSTENAQEAIQDDLSQAPELWAHIEFCSDAYHATEDADALVIMTEWKSFRSPNFDVLAKQLSQSIIFDGRNLYDPVALQNLGFEYFGIGRQSMPKQNQQHAQANRYTQNHDHLIDRQLQV